MEQEIFIRPITSDDIVATLEIYRYYVEFSSVTFDCEVPSLSEFTAKVNGIKEEFPWLVCLLNNKIIGYAYASKHRVKSAYKWSVESTIYVAKGFHRIGIARMLYEALFTSLKSQGFLNVFAGVSLPNTSSEAFHLAMGFNEVGIYKNTGYKLGNWHDVKWFQFHLSPHPDNPGDPIPFNLLKQTDGS